MYEKKKKKKLTEIVSRDQNPSDVYTIEVVSISFSVAVRLFALIIVYRMKSGDVRRY